MKIWHLDNESNFVETLLQCDRLKTPADRDNVVRHLLQEVSDRIKRFPSAQTDVNGILTVCMQVDGGVAQFLDVIRF